MAARRRARVWVVEEDGHPIDYGDNGWAFGFFRKADADAECRHWLTQTPRRNAKPVAYERVEPKEAQL